MAKSGRGERATRKRFLCRRDRIGGSQRIVSKVACYRFILEMNFDSRLLTGIPVVAAVLDAGSFAGAGKAPD
jgi:hypothetical protein